MVYFFTKTGILMDGETIEKNSGSLYFCRLYKETASKQKLIENAVEEGDMWVYSGNMVRFLGYNHA